MSEIFSKSSVYAIIPARNEEKHILSVVQKTKKFLNNVIVIDDGSSDKTSELAKQARAELIVHEKNTGKGDALKDGCNMAFKNGAKAVIFIDSDGQHNPEEIPLFIKQLNKGSQVVFGVRWLDANMPLIRLLGNKFSSVLINVLFEAFIPDIPSGYKAMTKEAFYKIDWKSSRYEVETEIAARVGQLKIPFALVPIETIYHPNQKGMPLITVAKIAVKVIFWRLFNSY